MLVLEWTATAARKLAFWIFLHKFFRNKRHSTPFPKFGKPFFVTKPLEQRGGRRDAGNDSPAAGATLSFQARTPAHSTAEDKIPPSAAGRGSDGFRR